MHRVSTLAGSKKRMCKCVLWEDESVALVDLIKRFKTHKQIHNAESNTTPPCSSPYN
jgi:hypothetical protein